MKYTDDFLEDIINEVISQVLSEGLRIQHAEDLVFWEGSKGALRSVKGILSLENDGYKNLTIKWDGSPTVIFGRDSSGQFVLTNKAGFNAKGYDGKSKSGKELELMFLNMGKVPADQKTEEYKTFASNMGKLFPYFEKSLSPDFRGFFSGDFLYITKPPVENGKFVFKPGIVTYKVEVNSEFGARIGRSKCGVVIHRQLDNSGIETGVKDFNVIKQGDVFVVPPVTVKSPTKIDKNRAKSILNDIKSHGKEIDDLLNKDVLIKMKLSNFSEILYTYTNSKVDTGLENIGSDFIKWVESSDKISDIKKSKILEHITSNKIGFEFLWKVVGGIMELKESVIDQLESQKGDVSASIGDTYKGGEGYVLSHPHGDMKFVSRPRFTAASRLAHSKPDLHEGGNVFKSKSGVIETSRISKSDVNTTVKWLEAVTSLPLLNNILGTAGKRETSGDLDLAVDEKSTSKDSLVKVLSDWCVSNGKNSSDFIRKSGDSVHFKTPINGDDKNGFVQTDLMFGDPEWMRWSLQGGKDDSQYKGMHRHVLLASIAKFKNMKWSYKNGLVDRTSDKVITKNPAEISKLLLGDESHPSDLDFFESIIDRIKNNKDFENMVADARETLIKYGVKF